MTIEPEISIEDLVRTYPRSVRFLAERGIRCIACGEPIWGSLREAAQEKGFSETEVEQISRDLTAFLAQED